MIGHNTQPGSEKKPRKETELNVLLVGHHEGSSCSCISDTACARDRRACSRASENDVTLSVPPSPLQCPYRAWQMQNST